MVTLIFMHLNYENKIIWGLVAYPLFIFVLILGGTLGDAAVKRSPIPLSHKITPPGKSAPVHQDPPMAEDMDAEASHQSKGK